MAETEAKTYSIQFNGMGGDNPSLPVTLLELEHLLKSGLARIQGNKIRSEVLRSLGDYHSPQVQVYPEAGEDDA